MRACVHACVRVSLIACLPELDGESRRLFCGSRSSQADNGQASHHGIDLRDTGIPPTLFEAFSYIAPIPTYVHTDARRDPLPWRA